MRSKSTAAGLKRTCGGAFSQTKLQNPEGKASAAMERFGELSAGIKTTGNRMAGFAELKTCIVSYYKTRSVYAEKYITILL